MSIKMTTPADALATKVAAGNPPTVPSKLTKAGYQTLMQHPAYKSDATFSQRVDSVRSQSIKGEQAEYQIQMRNAALGNGIKGRN